MTKLEKYGGGFVTVIVALGIYASLDKNSNPQQTQPSENSYVAAFEVDAKTIAADYGENTVKADMHYKGKHFLVNGEVTDINTDITGAAVLILAGDNNNLFGAVNATLDESAKSVAAELKKGETVRIFCTGNGDVAKMPMLSECVFVTK